MLAERRDRSASPNSSLPKEAGASLVAVKGEWQNGSRHDHAQSFTRDQAHPLCRVVSVPPETVRRKKRANRKSCPPSLKALINCAHLNTPARRETLCVGSRHSRVEITGMSDLTALMGSKHMLVRLKPGR